MVVLYSKANGHDLLFHYIYISFVVGYTNNEVIVATKRVKSRRFSFNPPEDFIEEAKVLSYQTGKPQGSLLREGFALAKVYYDEVQKGNHVTITGRRG